HGSPLHLAPARVVDREPLRPHGEERLALAIAHALEVEVCDAAEHDRTEITDLQSRLLPQLPPPGANHHVPSPGRAGSQSCSRRSAPCSSTTSTRAATRSVIDTPAILARAG